MAKAWKINDSDQPNFSSNYKVTERWEGNQTNVAKNSNKFYHAEVQVESGGGRARVYTIYGRVGKTSAANYRYFNSETECVREFNKLVNKKKNRKKDPYVEVELAIIAVGSDGAKDIKKAMTGINIDKKKDASKLHSEVQRLVGSWFKDTGNFVKMNLQCPLGQLSVEQIKKGRKILKECRKRINSNIKSSNYELDLITSDFFSNIPHILPRKIIAEKIRLDSIEKIMEREDILNTFLDVKNISNFESNIDKRYQSLNAKIEWVNPKDPIYKWINDTIYGTRAKNHRNLGNIKIKNIFKINRNREYDIFINRAMEIISERRSNKEFIWPSILKPYGLKRCDYQSNKEKEIFRKANILPLFHGSRSSNFVGLISRGLLIRPSGVVYCGAMYGNGAYVGHFSKAAQYSSVRGTYWAQQTDNVGYVLLVDTCLGDPLITERSYYYTNKIIESKRKHSVWAKAGRELINDEFITYYQSGDLKQQTNIRFIIEFSN